jgi:hypothetical protein
MSTSTGTWTALAAKLDAQQASKPASAAWEAWQAKMDGRNWTPEQRKAATTVLVKLMKIRAARATPAQTCLF